MDRTANEIWQKVLPLLEKEVSILSYDVWIKTLEPIKIIEEKLIVMAVSESGRDFVSSRYLELINRAITMVSEIITEVQIVSNESIKDTVLEKILLKDKENAGQDEDRLLQLTLEEKVKEQSKKQEMGDSGLKSGDFMTIKPQYNFESFVVGKSNKLAYAAANSVASEPGTRYNPLFIYGGAGLGKTHLMHAIGNEIRINKPHLKVLFVSSEKFVSDVIAYIGMSKDGSALREKYRSVDVLMVDDIQFISGKVATTEEIFHTFNALHDAGKQMVFTSDREPKEIKDIDDRLKSRFEWGFKADVLPPDLETRIAILKKKAQGLKANVSMDVLGAMAEAVKSNVREMEGLLNKVLMLAQLEETSASIDLVKEAIKDYSDRGDDEIGPDDIIEAVCKLFNIKKDDLLGKKKTRDVVEPRQLCIYCMTEMLDLPLAAIGNIFGGRDHATVLYSRDKIMQKLKSGGGGKTKAYVEDIKNLVWQK
ncbi:MAG: chromosomal replication initiator protein DnaA [Firmicutes bacterium]|nr:chromosomal replication initiator protein DnaA [Bacillota bacterium]